MTSMDKSWRKPVFKRLILSFLFILLPIYILSIVIYAFGINTLHEQISRAAISQTSSYLEGLETQIKRIRELQYDFLSDKDLNKLAAIPQSLDIISKTECILRVQQRIMAVKNSSVYIEEVYVLIPAIDKILLAGEVDEFDAAMFEKLKNIPNSPDAQIMNVDKSMYISAAYPNISTKNKKDPIFIIAIKLSDKQIQKALLAMTNNTGEYIQLINMATQTVISTQNNTFVDNKALSEIYDQAGLSDKMADTLEIGNKRYLAVYSVSKFLSSILCKYIPEYSIFEPLRKYKSWFLFFAITSIGIVVIYALYIHKFIHKPLNSLAQALKKVEKGNFDIFIEHKSDDEFRYIYHRFNAMAENVKNLIDQVYKQKILAQRAELKQLQSQINPHFLYNSFFILSRRIKMGDYDVAVEFSKLLGRFFKVITRNAEDTILLADEVEHARVYAQIQSMSFSSRIKVCIEELPGEYCNVIVPRLILQPLLENALEHGLEEKTSGGILNMSYEQYDGGLKIIVEDNGDGMSNSKITELQEKLNIEDSDIETTGIVNIHRRLRLSLGSGSGLSFSRSHLGGLKVVLTLQLEEEKGNVQIIGG